MPHNPPLPDGLSLVGPFDTTRPSFLAGRPTEWETYLPFEPYRDQRRAIVQSRAPLTQSGFVTAELACGTGKTLFALARAIELVREPQSSFKRVLCVTSVKQQLNAFEDDLEVINANLPASVPPVRAVSLAGKGDMCSMADAGVINPDNIYDRCEALREPIFEWLEQWPPDYDYEWDNPFEALVERARVNSSFDDAIGTDTWMSRFLQDFGDDSDGFCGFYAHYLRSTASETSDHEHKYVPTRALSREELLTIASDYDLCPHAVMSDALETAEVVAGNYYHVFEPMTRQHLTDSIIDEQTLLVCDEAHAIVPTVRDLLTATRACSTLLAARKEVKELVLEPGHVDRHELVGEKLSSVRLEPSQVEKFASFLTALIDEVDDHAARRFDSEVSDEAGVEHHSLSDVLHVPLRPPTTPQPDQLSRWAMDEWEPTPWEWVCDVAMALGEVLPALAQLREEWDRTSVGSVGSVGRFFRRWGECGHERYFREVVLLKRDSRADEDQQWREHYRASLRLNNVLPAEEIAAQLDQFGGGILMSATLAPFDVYHRTTGLDLLASEGRPVETITAELSFPEANRESFAVSLPKFTYSNRGPTEAQYRTEEQDELRERYVQTVRAVVCQTPGNVLVGMPSYDEAQWMADALQGDPTVEKEVLADESSSIADTEALKAAFFAGCDGVLVTSLRGTLTEGVDYDGDRLSACVCCGVPIESLHPPSTDATRTAYEREFHKKNGFDFAFTIPAVRKSRQAIGRVIRGVDEVGVRVLVDRRWASDHRWDDVRGHLPPSVREEFTPLSSDDLGERIKGFWRSA